MASAVAQQLTVVFEGFAYPWDRSSDVAVAASSSEYFADVALASEPVPGASQELADEPGPDCAVAVAVGLAAVAAVVAPSSSFADFECSSPHMDLKTA